MMGLSRKVVSTLVYPAILIVLSIVLIAILMTVVIPKFQDFFGDFDGELPLLTIVVIRTGRRSCAATSSGSWPAPARSSSSAPGG